MPTLPINTEIFNSQEIFCQLNDCRLIDPTQDEWESVKGIVTSFLDCFMNGFKPEYLHIPGLFDTKHELIVLLEGAEVIKMEYLPKEEWNLEIKTFDPEGEPGFYGDRYRIDFKCVNDNKLKYRIEEDIALPGLASHQMQHLTNVEFRRFGRAIHSEHGDLVFQGYSNDYKNNRIVLSDPVLYTTTHSLTPASVVALAQQILNEEFNRIGMDAVERP